MQVYTYNLSETTPVALLNYTYNDILKLETTYFSSYENNFLDLNI